MNTVSKRQGAALYILAAHPEGLTGKEMVEKSFGLLSMFTVYTVLGHLADDALIDEATLSDGRTRYFINSKGKALL